MTHHRRPPLTGLKKRMDSHRGEKSHRAGKSRLPRDGFVRQTFRLPRLAAREKAKEFISTYPKAAYWTEIESWCEQPDDVIEFTMRRLPTAD